MTERNYSKMVIGDHFDPFPKEYFRGAEIRDYNLMPVGYNSGPFKLPLIPEEEWEERLEEQKARKAQLSNIRDYYKIKSTNQGRTNYCWAHSTVSCVMVSRVMAGMPHVPLSATSIAAKIKDFRNVGGWGSQSLEYAAQHGICRLADWPEGPAGLERHHDSPIVWETAKQYRITEWMDLDPRNKAQLVTCLLSGIPVVSDFNWWRHSVASLEIVSLKPFRTNIWNSWDDSWGENGEGVLEREKAIPDGMIAPLVTFGG